MTPLACYPETDLRKQPRAGNPNKGQRAPLIEKTKIQDWGGHGA